MKQIHFDELDSIKEDLANLEEDEMLNILDSEDNVKYIVVPAKAIENAQNALNSFKDSHTQVRIISPNEKLDISYEEYEHIKKEILKSIDETFKPNPEKLN